MVLMGLSSAGVQNFGFDVLINFPLGTGYFHVAKPFL